MTSSVLAQNLSQIWEEEAQDGVFALKLCLLPSFAALSFGGNLCPLQYYVHLIVAMRRSQLIY